MREEIILQFDAVNSSNVTTQATSSPDFSVGERGEVQELNGGISCRVMMQSSPRAERAGKGGWWGKLRAFGCFPQMPSPVPASHLDVNLMKEF